jgi:hypothetical protein
MLELISNTKFIREEIIALVQLRKFLCTKEAIKVIDKKLESLEKKLIDILEQNEKETTNAKEEIRKEKTKG